MGSRNPPDQKHLQGFKVFLIVKTPRKQIWSETSTSRNPNIFSLSSSCFQELKKPGFLPAPDSSAASLKTPSDPITGGSSPRIVIKRQQRLPWTGSHLPEGPLKIQKECSEKLGRKTPARRHCPQTQPQKYVFLQSNRNLER